MTPQFPFKTKYSMTQGYSENANSYPEGHHGGIDVVPLDNNYMRYPADMYAILPGKTIAIQDTDVKRGKGIKVRTELNSEFVDYLKGKGVVPKAHSGKVFLEHLYWHCLDVTDTDGDVDQQTRIAVAGNTGWVFSGGVQVPDNQKGKPPYPGLHLHLETVLVTESQTLNLDKDPRGRIDPMLILNYKPKDDMNEYVRTINLDGEVAGYIPLRDQRDIDLFNLIFNKKLKTEPDGSIKTDLMARKL
jgi:hypothetical protein